MRYDEPRPLRTGLITTHCGRGEVKLCARRLAEEFEVTLAESERMLSVCRFVIGPTIMNILYVTAIYLIHRLEHVFHGHACRQVLMYHAHTFSLDDNAEDLLKVQTSEGGNDEACLFSGTHVKSFPLIAHLPASNGL